MSERRPVRPGRARPRRSRARGGSGAGPGVCRMPTGPRGPGWWSSSHRQCHGNGMTGTIRGDVEGGCYTPRGMGLGEADTRAKLIDPALHARGWTEDLIRREETAGAVEVVSERARRRPKGRVDYTLRVKVNAASQPVAVGLLEAKAEHLPPPHGPG